MVADRWYYLRHPKGFSPDLLDCVRSGWLCWKAHVEATKSTPWPDGGVAFAAYARCSADRGRSMQGMTVALALIAVAAGRASVAAEPPGEQFTRLLGFRLLDVSLAEVQERFGVTELKQSGDAGEYEAGVCYVVGPARTAVIFKSGELGGQRHDLLAVELRRYPNEAPRGCRVLDSKLVASSDQHRRAEAGHDAPGIHEHPWPGGADARWWLGPGVRPSGADDGAGTSPQSGFGRLSLLGRADNGERALPGRCSRRPDGVEDGDIVTSRPRA